MSSNLPEGLNHIAIIMDGNGRWAGKNLKARILGHNKGSETVSVVTRYCAEIELPVLSLFAFSTENWNRPSEEVNALMNLFSKYLKKEAPIIIANNIKFIFTGEFNRLPDFIQKEASELIEKTKNNTGMILNLCVSYSGRQEIVETSKKLCNDVIEGKLKVEDINKELFSKNLWTADLPDPDLLIRTSGEYRISNFMLWQMAYTEFYITNVLWPDFTINDLEEAIASFSDRKRRFGKI